MDEKEIKFIQDQIGYTFKNQELLVQAFTRRSYSMENGGQDNEVLESIGDKALDFCCREAALRAIRPLFKEVSELGKEG